MICDDLTKFHKNAINERWNSCLLFRIMLLSSPTSDLKSQNVMLPPVTVILLPETVFPPDAVY